MAARKPRPLVTMSCELCGEQFATKRPELAKFCSSKCQSRNRGKRIYKAAWSAERYKRRMADPKTRAEYNRVARERTRKIKDWLNAYKVEHGCIDCGYRLHPAALDIDHVEGKTANVSSLKSIKAIQTEIARHKCVVRCANCHRIKSWKTKTWLVDRPIDPAVLAETYERVEVNV